MKLKELIKALSHYHKNDDISFNFLKNEKLTSCKLQEISFYSDSQKIELTIQDINEIGDN
jgi:hypothetical protein|tara:strand:- start:77 stop:256 length:180 start_codon:yes stop_codon:yes gene_type:complete